MPLARLAAGFLVLVSASLPQVGDGAVSRLPIDAAEKRRLAADLRHRRFEAAETLLLKEANKQPKAAALFAFAGRVFFLDRKYTNCVIAYSKAEKLAPLGELDQFTMAMAFLAIERQDWAKLQLEKLHSDHPADARYVYWLGKLDFDQQNLPEAIEKFETAIRLDPLFVKALDMLGVSEEIGGKDAEAIRHHERAVDLNRWSVSPSPWPPLNYGIMLVRVGDLASAEPLLREALNYDPDLAEAHYRLGTCLEKKNRYEDAGAEYIRASELDPTAPAPWYALSRTLRTEGRVAEAERAAAEFKRRSEVSKRAGSVKR
jgi:tetratricopeptide (TPR) repeat protein